MALGRRLLRLDRFSLAARNDRPSAELLFGNGGRFWPADWTRDMRTLVVVARYRDQWRKFLQGGPGGANYDVSPNGKRFLMVQEPERGAPRLNVIQGWQRLGTEKAAPNSLSIMVP